MTAYALVASRASTAVGLWFLALGALLQLACSEEAVKRTAPPAEAGSVEITARSGAWTASYAGLNKVCDGRLIAPVGEPLAVTFNAPHKSHRLCLEEPRLDERVVGGGETAFWLSPAEAPARRSVGAGCPEATETLRGTWQLVSASDWAAWKRSGDCAPLDPSAPDYGARLFVRYACATCHSLDGSRGSGPPLNDLMGRKELLVDGTEIVVDEAYIRESILKPDAKVVKGYAPNMPSQGDELAGPKLDALVGYLMGQTTATTKSDEPSR